MLTLTLTLTQNPNPNTLTLPLTLNSNDARHSDRPPIDKLAAVCGHVSAIGAAGL